MTQLADVLVSNAKSEGSNPFSPTMESDIMHYATKEQIEKCNCEGCKSIRGLKKKAKKNK